MFAGGDGRERCLAATGHASRPAPRRRSVQRRRDGLRHQGRADRHAGGPADREGHDRHRDGRITAVGATVPVPAGAEVHRRQRACEVYPGLFDAVSRARPDRNRRRSTRPTTSPRSAPSTRSSSPRARCIRRASTFRWRAPTASRTRWRVPGPPRRVRQRRGDRRTGVGDHLDGWTIEEMLMQPSVGVLVNWPRRATARPSTSPTVSQRARPFSEVKEEHDKQIARAGRLDRTGARAIARRAKRRRPRTDRDLKLEALGAGRGRRAAAARRRRATTATSATRIAFCAEAQAEDGPRSAATRPSKIAGLLAKKQVSGDSRPDAGAAEPTTSRTTRRQRRRRAAQGRRQVRALDVQLVRLAQPAVRDRHGGRLTACRATRR